MFLTFHHDHLHKLMQLLSILKPKFWGCNTSIMARNQPHLKDNSGI